MKLKKSLAAVLSLTALFSMSTALVGCKKEKQPENPPVTNDDETVVDSVLENLTVTSTVTENFTLPITGVGGVTISWSSANANIISIVGGNATVVRPADKDTAVELTATATLNSVEKTKKFTVTVTMQEDTSMSISDVLAAEDGATVEVKGVVTGLVKKYASDAFSVNGYWVTDETGTIYVYGQSDVAKGNLVSIKGTKKVDTYNQAKGVVLHEITTPEVTVIKESEATPEFAGAIETTIGDLLALEEGCAGKVYKLTATVAVNVNTNDDYTNFQLKDGSLNLGEYVSGSLSASKTYESEFADYYTNKDKEMVVYYAVQGKTGSGKWRGTALAMVEPTDADKASSQAAAALNKVADTFFAVEEVTLPTDATFTVATNDYCTVADGKLKITSLPAKGQPASVELTATATVNGASKSAKKTIVITADAEKDITASVTIADGKISIPYNVMDETRVYVIKVDDTTTVKITPTNTSVNAGYKEFMIGKNGGSLLVTIEGSDKKLTSIVTDVFGSYDNIKFYVGSDATGTAVTATSTETGATNGKLYTYLTGTADAIYFENPSTHDVGLFNFYITVGTEALKPGTTPEPTPTPLPAGVLAQVSFADKKISDTTWTYITNNASYPNPSFYATGLKLNFEKMGVKSGTFEATNKVSVSLNIAALNPNTKTSSSTDFFTIKGYNAAGEVVATATLTSVAVGENAVTLEGEGIVSVEIVMTGYPTVGGTAQNVNLGGVTVSKVE